MQTIYYFVTVYIIVTSQLQGPCLRPKLRLFSVWSSTCSCSVHMGFLCTHPVSSHFPKTFWWIGYTKLPVDVNEFTCVSVRVYSALNWSAVPSRMYRCLAWPCPEWSSYGRRMNGWINQMYWHVFTPLLSIVHQFMLKMSAALLITWDMHKFLRNTHNLKDKLFN